MLVPSRGIEPLCFYTSGLRPEGRHHWPGLGIAKKWCGWADSNRHATLCFARPSQDRMSASSNTPAMEGAGRLELPRMSWLRTRPLGHFALAPIGGSSRGRTGGLLIAKQALIPTEL